MPVIVDRTGTRTLTCDGCRAPLYDDNLAKDEFVTLLSRDHSWSFCRLGCLRTWALRFDAPAGLG